MSQQFPSRVDLIGKRILTNDKNDGKAIVARRGVIRASSTPNYLDSHTKVLVEYDDDKSWRCRQWIEINKTFRSCFVEDKLIWASKPIGSIAILKTALSFRPLGVDDQLSRRSVLVQYFCDRSVTYRPLASCLPFKVDDLRKVDGEDRRAVMDWIDCHCSQLLLLGSPSLAVGHKVQVYNSVDDESQWRSVWISSANDQTKLVTLLYESTSEERTENAALIQIHGLRMSSDPKLWTAALKLAQKRPNEDLNSPVDSKRMRIIVIEDDEPCSVQPEKSSAKHSDDALQSAAHSPHKSPPETTAQCLVTGYSQHMPGNSQHMQGNSQHTPTTQANTSPLKAVASPIFVDSPPPVHRTSSIEPPVPSSVSAPTQPPQCSNSTATPLINPSTHNDVKKVCSLFRYRPQSPATFQKSPTAGFYHAGIRFQCPTMVPPNKTNIAEPLQKTGTVITSNLSYPSTPQNGLCSPITARVDDTQSAGESSLSKVTDNRNACEDVEGEEEGQSRIPVVIHSERERKWSSPGSRNARHASGGDGRDFHHNASPTKSPNLILVDDDDLVETAKVVECEKTDASNGAVDTSQVNQLTANQLTANQLTAYQPTANQPTANQPMVNHHSNRPKDIMNYRLINSGETTKFDQTKLYQEFNQPKPNPMRFQHFHRNSWLGEMQRFIGSTLPPVEPTGNQPIGTGSHIQTSSEVVAKYRLLNSISQRQPTLGNSTASNQPSKLKVKEIKQEGATVQQKVTCPGPPPAKNKSSETTAKFKSTKDEKPPTLKNPKSTPVKKLPTLKNLKLSPVKRRTLNSSKVVSGSRVPSMPRTGASGSEEDRLRRSVVKGRDEETQGLYGVMMLLKALDGKLIWPELTEGGWKEDAMTTTRKARKKKPAKNSELTKSLPSDPVNSDESDSNSPHSQFVVADSYTKAPPHDCEIKLAKFKKSMFGGKEYESPSCILSKKLLNGPDALLPRNAFVQEDSCLDLASAVTICRECKSSQKSVDKNTKILCRFFAFRRLNTTSKGTCRAVGFCNPCDADGADVSLWMPLVPITAPQIDIDMAKYIIKNVGNRFCELVEQEKEAMTWCSAFSEIVWKRPVHGVREMCDVCSTTLFNIHWVCGKCGFVVCLDCFRTMTQKCATCTDEVGCKICERGHNRWPRCTHSTRPLHVPSQLMLTQIIPSDVLWSIGRMIHDVRKKWKMFTNCPCGEDRQDDCETGNGLLPSDENKQAIQDSCEAVCTGGASVDEKESCKTVSCVSPPPVTDNVVSQKTVLLEGHKLLTGSPIKKEMNTKVFDVPLKNGDGKPFTSSSGRKEKNKKVVDVTPKSGDGKRLASSSGKRERKKTFFDGSFRNGKSKPITTLSGKKEKKNKDVSRVTSLNGESKPIAGSSDKKEKSKKVVVITPCNGEDSKPKFTSSSGKIDRNKKVVVITPCKLISSSSGKIEKIKKVVDMTPRNDDSKPLTTSSTGENEMDKKVFNTPQSTVDTSEWKSPKVEIEAPLASSTSSLRDMIMKNITLADVKTERKSPKKSVQTLDDITQKVAGNYKRHHVALAPLLHSPDPPKPLPVMRKANPIPRNCLSTTRLQYPDVAHAWLDDGRLLQLLEPRHRSNIHLFQQQWKHGQPVLISKCDQYLNQDLWLPESFAREFGDEENDLVDCTRKVVLVGHKMRRFWDGFENVTARLKDKHGQPMILKLKDWPPTEDFSELLPSRFEDLLHSLPMPEYTHRTGVFNLVSRLPEFFVRPDLGPKMYNAYGSALYPKVGSTNLHLDVSDAVNLILYVGIPLDDKEDHEAAAVEAMKEAGCCEMTMGRILNGGEKPGALWHIFDPQDSDKIRDLLHKVASELGEPIGPHHDPIHDQSWYLDEKLRSRLFAEYAVECYTLVQCVGDAIFIPAGAPHQVRNLHSCIKAAEDFVSPENLSYCFKLTQEFRHLSDKHSNHEDKLQVKNVIYHAVKDAIAVLMHHDP